MSEFDQPRSSAAGRWRGTMMGMFKVTFRNAANDRDLAKQVFLPELPQKGERVQVRQETDSWREQKGVVTERIWFIVENDPGSSAVLIMVALD